MFLNTKDYYWTSDAVAKYKETRAMDVLRQSKAELMKLRNEKADLEKECNSLRSGKGLPPRTEDPALKELRTAKAALDLLEEVRRRTGREFPLLWSHESTGSGAIEVYPDEKSKTFVCLAAIQKTQKQEMSCCPKIYNRNVVGRTDGAQ